MQAPGWYKPFQSSRLRAIHPTPHPFSRAGGLESLQEEFGPDPTRFLLEGLEEFEQMHPKAGKAMPVLMLFLQRRSVWGSG